MDISELKGPWISMIGRGKVRVAADERDHSAVGVGIPGGSILGQQ